MSYNRGPKPSYLSEPHFEPTGCQRVQRFLTCAFLALVIPLCLALIYFSVIR